MSHRIFWLPDLSHAAERALALNPAPANGREISETARSSCRTIWPALVWTDAASPGCL